MLRLTVLTSLFYFVLAGLCEIYRWIFDLAVVERRKKCLARFSGGINLSCLWGYPDLTACKLWTNLGSLRRHFYRTVSVVGPAN